MLFPILFGRVFFLLLPLLFSPGERILLYEIMEMLSIALTTSFLMTCDILGLLCADCPKQLVPFSFSNLLDVKCI